MSLSAWKRVSAVMSWFFDREYSVFELLALMSLITMTNNLFVLLVIGFLIVFIGAFMRGVSEALADHVKG